MSNRTLKFLNEAVNEAHQSDLLMKHGCVAVINGRIIGRGHNYYCTKSRDGFVNCCSSCHAEISALRNVYHHYGYKENYLPLIKGMQG